MGKPDWEKIEEIVDKSLTLNGSGRTRYIQRTCAKDRELRAEVEKLIHSIESSEGFLEDSQDVKTAFLHNLKTENSSDNTAHELLGTVIGKYRLDDILGHGGMGTVYLANRADGRFDQKVALKVIREDVLSPELRKRFTDEQRILAGLNHDNIARLYDGGVTPEGLPYLIMEYVEGIPIDKYCDQKKLPVRERIELLKSVFEAVQYAHNNLIIHRDLKPENILVTRSGSIKILDFGIATFQKKEPQGYNSQLTSGFLTPKSAAPEQFSDLPITTETDVYSLGLLLYRLLTGTHPLDFSGKSASEMIQTLQSEAAPAATERFSQLSIEDKNRTAENRETTPRRLEKQLKGDLDTILKKSLSFRKENRYSTVDLMWSELQLHLAQKPITSLQDKHTYRAVKFLKRNRTFLMAAAIIFIIFTAMVIHYSGQVKAERDYAMHQADKAEEVTSFLLELFEANDPAYSQGEVITALNMLDRGLERAETIENEELRASMFTTIGDAYTRLSEFDRAQPVLDQALDLSTQAFGEVSVEAANAQFALGKYQSDNHMWHLALPFYERSHEIYSSLLPDDHPSVAMSLSRIGMALLQLGEPDSAMIFSEKAYSIMEKNHSHNHPDLLNAMNEYALVLSASHPEKAEEIYLNVISRHLESGNQFNYRLASPYNNLGMLYRNMEKYELSEQYYKKSLEVSRLTMGEDHRFTRMVHTNLLTPLFHLQKHEEAESILETNIEVNKERFSDNHWRTGNAYGAYGVYMANIGNYEKADSMFENQYRIYSGELGEDHVWTGYAMGALAFTKRFLNEPEMAETYYQHHLEIFEKWKPDFNNDNTNQIRRLITMYEDASGDHSSIIEKYESLLN
jgi:eukaryotic-like serine/threonine-protein kinase